LSCYNIVHKTALFLPYLQQAVTVVTLIVAIPTASVVIIQSNEVAQATIHRLYILILQGPVKGQIAQPQLYPGRMEPFMNICISTGMQQIVLRARELRADVFFVNYAIGYAEIQGNFLYRRC